ncbi:HEAT repeat domain-containing protein [Microcoleus sp. A003_D6]|uniref:HEAT repeat domain-containing protein n=1 Tax=Microcoleus sp. A003_D6 TaxID=3055266 RepID=UPI002FCF996F
MDSAATLIQQLPELSDAQFNQKYLKQKQGMHTLAEILPQVEQKSLALHAVKLALKVNLKLGSKLAGTVKPEFQKATLRLIGKIKTSPKLKIQLLALTSSDVAIPMLVKALNHKQSAVRLHCIRAIGKIGSEAAVIELARSLESEDSQVQAWAAWALGEIDSKPAASALLKALNHKTSGVRVWAVWALGKINPKTAVPPLLKALKHQDSEVRWRAAVNCGKIGVSGVVPGLMNALRDENQIVRARAAAALGKIGARSAVPRLVELLHDPDSHAVSLRAAEALGQIGTEKAVAGLLQALNHDDSDVRGCAVSALGEISSEVAAVAVMRSLSDRDIFVRGRAAVALGNINTAGDANLQKMATAGLAIAIGDSESYVRWRVADALGQIGTEEAVAGLVRLLGDETSGVRQKAVKSLAQIGSPAGLLALEAALNREFADVRALAAQYLPDASTEAETVDLDPSASADLSVEKLPKILIASEAEASEYIVARTAGRELKYLISIGSPGVPEPKIFHKVPNRLLLEFNDLDTPVDDPDRVLPALDDVLQIIDFALKMSARPGKLLVLGQSGISRSTAAALTVCAAVLGRGKEREAWALVLAARPQARPNRWIVELADEALGRNGKLAAEIELTTATDRDRNCQQLTPRNSVSFRKS